MKFNNASLEFQILKYKHELKALLPNIAKSDISAQLYNTILIKKAVLTDKLKKRRENLFFKFSKKIKLKKEKLICDYFSK